MNLPRPPSQPPIKPVAFYQVRVGCWLPDAITTLHLKGPAPAWGIPLAREGMTLAGGIYPAISENTFLVHYLFYNSKQLVRSLPPPSSPVRQFTSTSNVLKE
jgi:hypothetical protein